MNKKNTTGHVMSLLTACACAVAAISFFMPLISYNFFGSWSYSGIDFIAEDIEDAYPLAIALGCSVIGFIVGIAGNKNGKSLIVNLLLSVVGIGMMVFIFVEEDIFSEAGMGFYLFMTMHLAAIIMSIAGLSGSESGGETEEKKICPNCGKKVRENQMFCDNCGVNLGEKPEPPMENKCKACGKVIDKDVAFCRFCGASTKEVPVPPISPAPPTSPANKPVKRTAICPHCGAKQLEGTTTCKYCGTSMH